MGKLRNLLGFAALCGLLGSCAPPGGPVSNPVGRTLSWYSYVGGEDIRARCMPGSQDTLRFVYNGIYKEQVRTYDVTTDVVSPGAILQARVNGPSNLVSFDLSDPVGTWRGAAYQHFISPQERDGLAQALDASGFGRPAPNGLFLRSDWFYWAVSACRRGSFHFYAWQQPDDDLSKLAFIPALLALDKTGIDFNAPHQVYLGPFDPAQRAGNAAFQLEVGANGLVLGPSF
jgi:hypothetical protein